MPSPLDSIHRHEREAYVGQLLSLNTLVSAEITKGRAKYLADVLYARMHFETPMTTKEESDARIQLEIAESGWKDVKIEYVDREIRAISGYMRDFGPEGYIAAVRKSLGEHFGVKFPE